MPHTLAFVVPAEKLDALKKKLLEEDGLKLPDSDEGDIEFKGVTVQYDYDRANETLSMTVTHHPFFEPEGMIDSKISSWLENQ